MTTRKPWLWLIGSVMWILSGLGTAVCWGDAQANTYTTGNQVRSSVSADADGDFVVVWNGGTDPFANNVKGQRYASSGSPAGGEFQVNTFSTGNQYAPSVAVDADGDFVVVWTSRSSTNPLTIDIQGQRYASDGSPIGGEFQVNSYTTNEQYFPSVSLDADGDFVVVWTSRESGGTDTSEASIQGQRYASDGSSVGGQFQVNTHTPANQSFASVSLDADGDFVVAWLSGSSAGTDTSLGSIQGQRFASNGSPAGDQFQVNTYTTGYQYYSSVSMDEDGDFVVVWSTLGLQPGALSVQGQRYASNGAPVDDEFQISTFNTNTTYQSGSALSVDSNSNGDFVVVWNSYGSGGNDTSGSSAQAQIFASNGSPLTGQFQVNTYTTGSQFDPSVSLATDSSASIVVWTSSGSGGTDSSGLSIQWSNLFSDIFADGFESGDTTAWSSTVE